MKRHRLPTGSYWNLIYLTAISSHYSRSDWDVSMNGQAIRNDQEKLFDAFEEIYPHLLWIGEGTRDATGRCRTLRAIQEKESFSHPIFNPPPTELTTTRRSSATIQSVTPLFPPGLPVHHQPHQDCRRRSFHTSSRILFPFQFLFLNQRLHGVFAGL